MEEIIVIGEVVVKEETKVVGAKEFKKRLVVVKTDGTHPQSIPIEFVQEKVDLLDSIQIGQKVKISVNLRGSESNGKWYPGIQGWRIE